MVIENTWVFDTETYLDCFVLVARLLESKHYVKFVVHESRDDTAQLLEWLDNRPTLISYNGLNFDAFIVETIFKQRKVKPEFIYDVAQRIINSQEQSFVKFSFKHIDLLKINHYDWGPMATSLKWLAFSTREDDLSDLPLAFDKSVSKSNVDKIVTYCKKDVDKTYNFYYRCKSMISTRENLAEHFRADNVINMSDSSLGSFFVKRLYSQEIGIPENKLTRGTHRDQINIKECILPYVEFISDPFIEVLDLFSNTVLIAQDGKIELKAALSKEIEFDGMTYSYGTGGLHACRQGTYAENNDYSILSIDVESFYPNLAIVNNFYPEHLGPVFCKVYKQIFDQRKEYPKGTELNYLYKIALNSVYGKSNTEYDQFLKDPMYTIKTTINGQLLLSMLAESLSNVGKLLMVNTDGMEILIHKSNIPLFDFICDEWSKLTNLKLEKAQYSKICIRDANCYWAMTTTGKIKRKNEFEIYYDYTEEDGKPHKYHKSPSGLIIPQAVNDYLEKGIPIEDTINNCTNIHEFLFGIKKQKGFNYLLLTPTEDGVVEVDKRTERVIRYYMSNNGATIYKMFLDDRKSDLVAVNKGQLVSLAMSIDKKKDINDYNINKNFYIFEAYKLLQSTQHE